MRYAFIRSEEDRYPLTVLCRVMRVSRSGYYAFVRRPPSQRARQETQLRVHVRAAFAASQRRVGTVLVATDRRTSGIQLEDESIELRAGSLCRLDAGSTTRWDVSRTLRKAYVIEKEATRA